MASLFYLVTGSIGGGKTYYVVEQCIQALKEGAQLYTNVDFREEWLDEHGYLDQVHKLPENPSDWPDFIKGGQEGAENVLAVDEAMYLFHMWDQQGSKKTNRPLFEIFPMVRKLGLECYMIAQDAGNVDNALRRQATAHVHCTNMSKTPVVGKLAAMYLGDFRRSFRNATSRTEIGAKYVRFNKRIAAAYKTDALFGASASRMERNVTRKAKDVSSGFKRAWWFWPVTLGTPAFILWSMSSAAVNTMSIGREKPPPLPHASVNKAPVALLAPAAPNAPLARQEDLHEGLRVDEDGLQVYEGEFIIATVATGYTFTVWTREGVRFTVGDLSDYGRVEGIERVGRNYNIFTDAGMYVCRPLTAVERRKLYARRAAAEQSPYAARLEQVREASRIGQLPSEGVGVPK